MCSNQEWADAYDIAEKMHNAGKPIPRTQLDEYEQIVCSRYDTIFSYDAYKDEYCFKNIFISLDKPQRSKCRPISAVDLAQIKANTVAAGISCPTYLNITPIYFAAPSVILAFNNNFVKNHELQRVLEKVAKTEMVNSFETSISPGTVVVYKHKDERCYRCLVISEIDDPTLSIANRKYKVIFLDTCQVSSISLRKIYTPKTDISLEAFPCPILCVRLRGVATLRKNYVSRFNDDLERFYVDRQRRKAGVDAIIYKIDFEENILIVDFPSLLDSMHLESQATILLQGHLALKQDDPKCWTLEAISRKEILPPEDQSVPIQKDDENDDNADIFSGCIPPISDDDCPTGRACIEQYLRAKKAANTSMASTILDQSEMNSRSALSTPLPTFDEPQSSSRKPNIFSSGNDETPKKEDELEKNNTTSGMQKPLRLQKLKPSIPIIETEDPNSSGVGNSQDVAFLKPDSPNRRTSTLISPDQESSFTHFGYLTPTENTILAKPCSTEKPKSPNFNIASSGKSNEPSDVSSVETVKVHFGQLPSIRPIVQTGPSSSIFGQMPAQAPSTFSEIKAQLDIVPPAFSSLRIAQFDENSGQISRETMVNIRESCSTSSENLRKSDEVDIIPEEIKTENEKLDISRVSSAAGSLLTAAVENFNDTSNEWLENKENRQLESTTRADDNISTRSICSGDLDDKKDEVAISKSTGIPSISDDDFPGVPEATKRLAEAFRLTIHNAAMEKNRHVFMNEIFALEVICRKRTSEDEQLYWNHIFNELRSLENF